MSKRAERAPPSGRRDSNPRPSAWKADALPTELLPLVEAGPAARAPPDPLSQAVGREGFEPPNSERPDLQSGAFNHSATCPGVSTPYRVRPGRAGEGTRTPNLLITNQLLYQLSYASDTPPFDPDGPGLHANGDGKLTPRAPGESTRPTLPKPAQGLFSVSWSAPDRAPRRRRTVRMSHAASPTASSAISTVPTRSTPPSSRASTSRLSTRA